MKIRMKSISLLLALFIALIIIPNTAQTQGVAANSSLPILSPDTEFTQTVVSVGYESYYMISFADGNLYYRERGWDLTDDLLYIPKYIENKLILDDVRSIHKMEYANGGWKRSYYAIKNNGDLYTWGSNHSGQLGDNTGVDNNTPQKILSSIKKIYIYGATVFALQTDGTLYSWGYNYGRAGVGDVESKYAPVKVPLEGVLKVYATESGSVHALLENGDGYVWGFNDGKPYVPQSYGKFDMNKYGSDDSAVLTSNLKFKLTPAGELYNIDKLIGNITGTTLSDAGNDSETLFATNVAALYYIQEYSNYAGSYITKERELYNWGDFVGDGTAIQREQPYLALKGIIQTSANLAYYRNDPTIRTALSDSGKLHVLHTKYSYNYIEVASNAYVLFSSSDILLSEVAQYLTCDGNMVGLSEGKERLEAKIELMDVALPQLIKEQNNTEQISLHDTPSSWAKIDIDRARTLGLLPNTLDSKYQQNITREEFCELAAPVYEKIKGTILPPNTPLFTDTTNGSVAKMAYVGVVSGIGNNKFIPTGEITRQEAAVMLGRLMEALGQPISPSASTFADINTAATWARDYIGKIQAAGIMTGVGSNNFNPLGKYTREQSIITLMRVYDLLPSPKILATPNDSGLSTLRATEYGGSTIRMIWRAVADAQIYAINWNVAGFEGHIITDNAYVDLNLPNVDGHIYVDIYACGSYNGKWVQSTKPLSKDFDVESVSPPNGYTDNPMRVLNDEVYVFAEKPTLWWSLCVDQEDGFASWPATALDAVDIAATPYTGVDSTAEALADGLSDGLAGDSTFSDNNLNYRVGSVWIKRKNDIVYSYGETYKGLLGVECVKIYDPVLCRTGWIFADKIGN